MKTVTIYTDGACSGNPGPGGWAAVLECDGRRKEICGGVRRTTNVRMELRAVLEALRCLRGNDLDITVYSDSQAVVSPFNSGSAKRNKVMNSDLWKGILEITDRMASVRFEWVKGHADNSGNNRCDELATGMSKSSPQETDEGYEKENAAPETGMFEKPDEDIAGIVTRGLDSVDGAAFMLYLKRNGLKIVRILD